MNIIRTSMPFAGLVTIICASALGMTSALARDDLPRPSSGCTVSQIHLPTGTFQGGPNSGWMNADVHWCWDRSGKMTSHRVDVTRDETLAGKAVGFTWRDDFVENPIYSSPSGMINTYELKGSYSICPLAVEIPTICLRKHYVYIKYTIKNRNQLTWSWRQT